MRISYFDSHLMAWTSSISQSTTTLFQRMSVATSHDEVDHSFIEVKKIPSDAFFKSMQIAQRDREKYPEDKEMLLPQAKKIGMKTLLSAIFMVLAGVVRYRYYCRCLSPLLITCFNRCCFLLDW